MPGGCYTIIWSVRKRFLQVSTAPGLPVLNSLKKRKKGSCFSIYTTSGKVFRNAHEVCRGGSPQIQSCLAGHEMKPSLPNGCI